MSASTTDKRAPMAAAPLKYTDDGTVDWGNMWDSFCALAQEGGPPQRGSMLYAPDNANTQSEGYCFAAAEIIRGIKEVSGLNAAPAGPGWIAIGCPSAGMARWLAEAIEQENVQAGCQGVLLLVPVGDYFTLKGEIKNVITAVAKTTHYWQEHVPLEVKQTLAWQEQLLEIKTRFKGWLFANKTALLPKI